MADPSFLHRCRLWTALFHYIPDEHEADAATLAAALDSGYWELSNENGRLYQDAAAELDTAKERIAALEARVHDLTLVDSTEPALGPPPTVTH